MPDSQDDSAHSRSASAARPAHQHAPTTPSQLRESHYPSPSPEVSTHTDFGRPGEPSSAKSGAHRSSSDVDNNGTRPTVAGHGSPTSARPSTPAQTALDAPDQNVRTRLLSPRDGERSPVHGSENHPHIMSPTRSPRPETSRSYGSFNSEILRDGFGGRYPGDDTDNTPGAATPLLGDSVTDGLLGGHGKHSSTTSWLADMHGIRNKKMMCVSWLLRWETSRQSEPY